MKSVSVVLSVVLLLCAGANAVAQEKVAAATETPAVKQGEPQPVKLPEWLDRISLEGITFIRYSREFDESAKDFNEFDLDRVYLVVWSKLSETMKVRYTMEGGDIRDGTGAADEFEVVTKHLFLEVKDAFLEGDYLRIGQTDLPWVPYAEGVWGYRFQGTIFADRSKYLTSTDLGIGWGGKIPDGYGSWQLNVANGEGWKKNETGKHKDFHLRVTLNPFAGSAGSEKNVFVTAFASAGKYEHDTALTGGEPTDRDRFIFQLGYKEPEAWMVGAEFLTASDPADKQVSNHPSLVARTGEESNAEGFSLYGTVNFSMLGLLEGEEAKSWELIARWDQLDPDDEIDDNGVDRYIGGICKKWNKSVRTLLDVEHADYEAQSLKNDESRLMLQMEVKF